MKETPLFFRPTYKYIKESNEYDKSEQDKDGEQVSPAWCDRGKITSNQSIYL